MDEQLAGQRGRRSRWPARGCRSSRSRDIRASVVPAAARRNRGSRSSMRAAQAALLANRRSSSGMRPAYHVRMTLQTPFEPSPLAPRPSPEDQARDRDLGFGSVVSRESRQRLLNRDGSFNVARSGLGFLDSFAPYHLLLTISWPGFLGRRGRVLPRAEPAVRRRLPGVRPGRAGRRRRGDARRAVRPARSSSASRRSRRSATARWRRTASPRTSSSPSKRWSA